LSNQLLDLQLSPSVPPIAINFSLILIPKKRNPTHWMGERAERSSRSPKKTSARGRVRVPLCFLCRRPQEHKISPRSWLGRLHIQWLIGQTIIIVNIKIYYIFLKREFQSSFPYFVLGR